jgi:hypothetical protein
MPVVDVVDVITVRDGLVAAALAVLVVVDVVGGVRGVGTLVPMPFVFEVGAAIVEVVDMVAVLDGRVATVRTMDVGMVFVDVMSAHDLPPCAVDVVCTLRAVRLRSPRTWGTAWSVRSRCERVD